MESLEAYYQENPRARIQAQQNASRSGGALRTSGDSYRLTAIVTIPVVTHIVLPNAAIVTDADVDYFINRLNVDYAGLNPDSTNAGPFLPLRGHSQIRFCRAKRTPGGLISTGIERRNSTTQANSSQTNDVIKSTAAGGLDVWDATSYLNIWVGIGDAGLLGYATFPGQAANSQQGVFVAFDTYANNSCYTQAAFNLGRTGSHEVGHWLGLYHNWGDDGNACTGDDFRQLPGTCLLPAGLFNPAGQGNTAADIGDTPNQAGNTPFNCPTGIVTDACATTAPGKMYQNYMDYTADACYSMFTNKQVARMEWVVDNCRAGLKTSLGCVPPAGFPVTDAGINTIVSPGGGEFNPATCTVTSYPAPTCPGAFTPRLSVTNFGTATITSITITLTVGATTVSQTFTVNIISGASTTLVFPAQNLVIGANTISFTITAVNGSPDTYTANNTASTTATVAAATALPFSQDFSGTTFPPANMTLAGSGGTWIRSAVGNGTPGSASIDNYNNDFTGQTADIRTISLTPPANPLPQDSLTISFDVAYKNYPNPANYDALSVLVSRDCGVTFTSVYSKSGPALATAGASGADYTTPAATDWRRERIKIGGAFLTGSSIIVAFRNLNNYGNRLFLDNINISKQADRDLSVSDIGNPGSIICSNSLTPQVTVTNNGLQTISSFRVGYRVNNGTIANQTFTQTLLPNASVTVNLAAAAGIPSGNNTITVFTADPVSTSGTGDQQTGNDTLTKSFAYTLLPLPFTQDFVTTTFPPPNMTLFNPTGTNTWVRNAAGNGTAGSAFINNYNNGGGEIDDIRTLPLAPPINPSVRDSVIISFDLAHRPYSLTNGTFFDTLRVLVSTDCGATFVPVYTRWPGSTPSLATGPVLTTSYLVPAAADWRREKISFTGSLITGSSIIVAFRNIAKLGNNIFLDNINIERTISRDIQLSSINQPGAITCTAITPSVTVKNTGVDTITGFKVGFVVDNGTPAITTFSNIILARDAVRTFSLTGVTLPTGTHTIRVYTFEPVTASGIGDQRPTNDTLTKVVQVVPLVNAPLNEGFEATTFPPAGWAINNPDGGITWVRTTAAARNGVGSAFVNNYNYAVAGSRDELYSPQVAYNGIDSISLAFDVAALTYSYPGSTAIPLDTLEVLATNDCGATLTSVYKKWGNELQTVNDPNMPQTAEFVPNSRTQWRRETINLSNYVGRGPLQLVFRNTNNFENNIYVDNIDLTTKTLPAKLKEQGYLIYPSPFSSSFTIQHYLSPTELRGIAVYNSVGQRVYAQTYGAGGASSSIQVDMSRVASGLYTVVLRYTNRTISQKIVKHQ